jgi:type IV secretory pathway TraG/TraD family ATPase VirD4
MEACGLGDPELKIPVRCLIDEARNIGKIPNLSEILATNRKYRLSLTLIFQSYPQIEEVYGKEQASEIFANCAGKLVLGADDEKTLRVFSEKLGKETVLALSTGISQSNSTSTSFNKQEVGRELMTKVQMEQMGSTECLVFFQKLKPFRAIRFELEKHPNYKYLAEKDGRYLFINPFQLAYDDEAIESARIKKVEEEGYIAPVAVDSARRRAKCAADCKKEQEAVQKMRQINPVESLQGIDPAACMPYDDYAFAYEFDLATDFTVEPVKSD